MVVEIHESYEPTELTLGLGLREIANSFDFLRKG